MSTPNHETRPRLFKLGRKLTAVGTADPSFTLIEVGDALGFLLADSCSESTMDTQLHLEEVIWIRYARQAGIKGRITRHHEIGLRSFEQVDLYRHSSGVFVVQDAHSKRYLPYPSNDPYFVVFLSKDQHDALRSEVQEKAISQMLESVGAVVRGLPGLSVEGNSVTAPASYANATAEGLEHALIEV